MIRKINNINLIESIVKQIFSINITPTIYSEIIIYEQNDKIVGFCLYDLIFERCEIEYIGVLEKYRNQKVASRLIEYIIDDAKKHNALNISLEVNINNNAALKLYKKYDFNIVSIRKNYYKKDDAYLMIKEI